jgi:ribosomal protein S18 acetylase RimI-like enzyme
MSAAQRVRSASVRAIRRLGPGDERFLATLAREDADFDVEGRSGAQRPLRTGAARAFLADPHVLLWIERHGAEIAGFLYCTLIRLRAGEPLELLLYEIGVRKARRRQSVGRRLLAAMFHWMREHRVAEVWVLADNPGAVKFYERCRFRVAKDAPVYMTARVRRATT